MIDFLRLLAVFGVLLLALGLAVWLPWKICTTLWSAFWGWRDRVHWSRTGITRQYVRDLKTDIRNIRRMPLEVIEKDVRYWFAQGMNFGVITDRAAVLDFDAKEPAREFFKQHRQLIKTIVETRRGVHFYFRNEDQIRNTTGTPDVRGIGGYVVAPGSLVEGHEYRFVDGYDEIDPRKMEALRAEWLPRKDSGTHGALEAIEESGEMVHRAREYLKTLPPAISGQKGHAATMRAAGVPTVISTTL